MKYLETKWLFLAIQVVLLILVYALAFFAPSTVQAKRAYAVQGKQEVYECIPVATMGLIEVARCMDDAYGTEFYMNNMGFMYYPTE